MNKKLESFLKEQNFTMETKGAYSFINDYQVAISEVKVYAAVMPMACIFSYISEEKLPVVMEYMKTNKKSLKILNYEISPMGVSFSFRNNKYADFLETIQRISAYLKEQETLNKAYCPYSGAPLEEEQKKKLFYKNFIVFLNEESVLKINEDIKREEEAYKNAPNNYLKGALGAVVGGALGAIVWVVVGALLGLISGWIALLIAVLAGLGYDKMKGKANYTKIIISSLVTLVYALFSMFLVYVLLVQNEMRIEGIEGNPVSILFELLANSEELRSGFIKDMVFGLIFGILGVVLSFFQMKKSLHQKQDILK